MDKYYKKFGLAHSMRLQIANKNTPENQPNKSRVAPQSLLGNKLQYTNFQKAYI